MLTDADRALIAAVQHGLPLVSEPYAAIAAQIGWTSAQVRERLAQWQASGVIKRLGVVVRHHELGYVHNAMVVWDVPDARVDAVAGVLAQAPGVTLCYRRPRRPPHWPYNLFCMIHARSRDAVRAQVHALVAAHGWNGIAHEVLFSTRRFKQRGARYAEAR